MLMLKNNSISKKTIHTFLFISNVIDSYKKKKKSFVIFLTSLNRSFQRLFDCLKYSYSVLKII